MTKFLNISTDNTLGGNAPSDELVVSQKAIKEYVDGQAGGGGYHPDLFTWQWADHELNDVQWLRADTFSWQSGAVYQAAYQHLTDDITGKTLQSETISGTTIQFYLSDDGHKICPASEENNVTAIYNATGVAWYYIIDTTNQRFKLPRTKFGFTGIRSGVGGYVEAGLPNLTGNAYSNGNDFVGTTTTGVFSGTTHRNGYGIGTTNVPYGNFANPLNFNASLSNSIYGNSDTVQPKATEMYLYFYVGNFTQTALENTAGLNAELFNDKVDKGHQVIEFQAPTSANNYTWYRKYADGWVEQGGQFTNTSRLTTINLPITMANNGYVINVTQAADSGYSSATSIGVQTGSITTTGFQALNWYASTYTTGLNWWQVSGMAA